MQLHFTHQSPGLLLTSEKLVRVVFGPLLASEDMWSDDDGADTASADAHCKGEVSGCCTVNDHDKGSSKCKTVTATVNFILRDEVFESCFML